METSLLNQRSRKSKYRCWSWEDSDGFSIISLCFLALSICVSVALVVKIYLGEPEVIPQGAVATDSKTCSQVGVDILKLGGNAIDAAVASTACMGVVSPHVTSIGGGGILIYHNQRTNKVPVVLNFREQSASQLKLTSGQSYGPETVGVPGLLRGLHKAHEMLGSLQWTTVVEPAMKLAFEGVPVTQEMAEALRGLNADSPLRASDNIFFNKGFPRAEGEILQNPSLGAALERITNNGALEFYEGETSVRLISQMKASGITWDPADLSGYSVQVESATQGSFGNKVVFTSGAPSVGPQLLSFLNLMEGFNFTSQDLRSPTFYHLLTESLRITQAQASHLGDPKFSPTVNNTVSQMVNETLSNDVRKQLHPDAVLPEDPSIPVLPKPAGTVVSVIDNDDNYVAVVSGLNSIFGSQILSPDGFLLNNALASFYPPNLNGSANVVEPRKRPLQSYVPLIVTESGRRCGQRLVTGAAEPSPLAQVVFNLLQFDWSVLDAVQAARLHAAIQNTQIGVERAHKVKIPEEILGALAGMGHVVKDAQQPYPSVNVVQKTGDTLTSHSDSRAGGYAVKYGP